MNTENKDFSAENAECIFSRINGFCSQLQNTIAQVNHAFEEYRFDLLAQLLYEFTWNEFCDWYLELSKCHLQTPQVAPELQRGVRRTLLEILETLLRLMHPLAPFITEEIWQTVAKMLNPQHPQSIMVAPYPEVSNSVTSDENAVKSIEWLKQVINGIRNVRGEMHVAPGKSISAFFFNGNEADRKYFQDCEIYIKSLAKISELTWLGVTEMPPQACATVVMGQLEIHIPLADLVDKSSELSRLEKEMEKLKRDQEKLVSRLDNPDYLKKAPAHVVEKERQNHQQIQHTLEKLQTNYLKIKS